MQSLLFRILRIRRLVGRTQFRFAWLIHLTGVPENHFQGRRGYINPFCVSGCYVVRIILKMNSGLQNADFMGLKMHFSVFF